MARTSYGHYSPQSFESTNTILFNYVFVMAMPKRVPNLSAETQVLSLYRPHLFPVLPQLLLNKFLRWPVFTSTTPNSIAACWNSLLAHKGQFGIRCAGGRKFKWVNTSLLWPYRHNCFHNLLDHQYFHYRRLLYSYWVKLLHLPCFSFLLISLGASGIKPLLQIVL